MSGEETLRAEDLRPQLLGECRVPSPLLQRRPALHHDLTPVLVASTLEELRAQQVSGGELPAFEAAGPRSRLFFVPGEITCGVLTSGGLCPGINTVLRSLTLALENSYGVRRIIGYRYGYAGLADPAAHPPILLDAERTKDIHEDGGTLLGTSRGPQPVGRLVDQLEADRVSGLFVIGGDGSLRGVAALSTEIERRGRAIAMVGIPKTIDNDLRFIERSFGFATAVEEAGRAIDAAHCEARGVRRGIGMVKLMGRYAGFIAAHATLSSGQVNVCLVPEVPFALDGEFGLLALLERRLERKGHAVIVVAEGAGQDLFPAPSRETDASGNRKLHDVGRLLVERIERHFGGGERRSLVRYIDPSYLIRGLPANTIDSELCLVLGQHAAHAALAGRTNLMIGYWNGHYTHVPIGLATRPKRLDPHGETWLRVLEATGQPALSADQR